MIGYGSSLPGVFIGKFLKKRIENRWQHTPGVLVH